MELLGNLKDKVSKAKSKDEAKGIIENAGILLTDEELDKIAGGGILQMEYANTPSEVSQGGSDGDSDGNVLTNEGGSIVFMSAPQYK